MTTNRAHLDTIGERLARAIRACKYSGLTEVSLDELIELTGILPPALDQVIDIFIGNGALERRGADTFFIF